MKILSQEQLTYVIQTAIIIILNEELRDKQKRTHKFQYVILTSTHRLTLSMLLLFIWSAY